MDTVLRRASLAVPGRPSAAPAGGASAGPVYQARTGIDISHEEGAGLRWPDPRRPWRRIP